MGLTRSLSETLGYFLNKNVKSPLYYSQSGFCRACFVERKSEKGIVSTSNFKPLSPLPTEFSSLFVLFRLH